WIRSGTGPWPGGGGRTARRLCLFLAARANGIRRAWSHSPTGGFVRHRAVPAGRPPVRGEAPGVGGRFADMAGTTHTVTNQAPPLVQYDVFGGDRALVEAVARHLDPRLRQEAESELTGLGRTSGSAQVQEWGALANEHPPRLRTHDRYGHRID